MGIKTTINEKGVFSESVAGDNTVVWENVTVTSTPAKNLIAPSASADLSMSHRTTTVLENLLAVGITASLPTINLVDLGSELVVVTDSTTNPVLVSGSQHINGNTAGLELGAAYEVLHLVAASGSVGFYWHVLNQEP